MMLKEGQYVQFINSKDGTHRAGLVVKSNISKEGREYIRLYYTDVQGNHQYRTFRRLQMDDVVVLN
jgi:hypothetical protein